ncbi:MAG: hypothetical protein A4E65_03784 [Syntrophorhabdus sp. PtaU1.Bin153]|nr:MAG: hypothetical protein A4E65_03784 [Syntrophorhabdus sp. PtaU1.Bin153]
MKRVAHGEPDTKGRFIRSALFIFRQTMDLLLGTYLLESYTIIKIFALQNTRK